MKNTMSHSALMKRIFSLETENKKLREENKYYQVFKEASELMLIINASPSIIYVYNLEEQKIKYVSGKIKDLTGFSADDLYNMTDAVTNIVYPEDLTKVNEILSNIQKSMVDEVADLEMRVYKKDQTFIWVNFSALVFEKDSKNNPLQIIGSISEITKRKYAELELKRNEEKYRLIVEGQSDMIIKINSKGQYLFVSPSYCEKFGMTEQELLNSKYLPSIHEDDRIKNAVIKEALKKVPYTCYIEQREMTKDGWRWLAWSQKAILDENNDIEEIICVGRDFTDKKITEQALTESEEKYRLLFETASDAIFMMNRDIFIDCNKATLKIYGCTSKQIIGQSPFHFSTEFQPDGSDSKTKALEKINDALTKGPQFFEWQHIKYDGTPFDAEVSLQKVELSGETYLQATVRDITYRKLAEKALIERESQLAETNKMLELILNTIPVRVFWKDRNFKFLGCNKLFAKDAGFDNPKSIIGKTDFNLSWKDQAHLYRTDDIKVLSTDLPVLNIEEPQSTPGGNIIWLKTNKIPLKNIYNETIGILGTYEDITERKLIEKKILDAIIKTEEKEREKFAKNLHDDLGPLLSSIKMYVNSILDISPEKQKYIVGQLNEIVKEAIQSTKEISNDLSPHVLKNYGLIAAIESFSRRVEEHIQIDFSSNITDFRFSEEIETSLYRIIKELFNNTIKHASASQIVIKLTADNTKINLSFSDNGTGFNITRVEKKESAGMGISNIISRVRSLKGTYLLSSDENQGMNFNLEIPLS